VPGDVGWLKIAFYSMALAQVSLAALWCGWGRGHLPWRLAMLVLIATGWAMALSRVANVEDYESFKTNWSLLLLALAAGILVASTLGRIARARIVAIHSSTDDAEPTVARWQFSIGYMLAWMTAVAIILGVLKSTLRINGTFVLEFVPILAATAIAWGLIALAALWAALGTNRTILRLALLVAAVAIAALILWSSGGVGTLWTAVRLSTFHAAWIVAALLVLRVAGYRIILGSKMPSYQRRS
jgi:hypothetical protein